MKSRSLEKAAKPKKHKDYKVVEEVEEEEEIIPLGTKVISVPITVAGFCEQTEASQSAVIMTLMRLGIMANINQNLDEDTCELVAAELGIDIMIDKVVEDIEETGIENFEDSEEDLVARPPIITVMGHVDHGKTSLLDAIRNTNVTAGESGGITQHIGASEVEINGKKIVFLDTPGHEAFTAMRARGAMVTDIAVLVVAADDSVKPQTIESISHAKAAGVPIIVAINKMDKPGANPDKVKQDLAENGILVEDWGGETICVPVSAKKGEGITELLEMILLQADVLELKANPNRLALGSVIEARLDKAKGPVASILVTNGTLKTGMPIVAGTCSGKIRRMVNDKGRTIKEAGPATAVKILGLTDVPQAGDEFNAVKEDKVAREIAENRQQKLRDEILARNASTSLEQLFSQINEGEVKDLNLIIKADVQGSVGAIVTSLEKLSNENVRVKIVHTGVGTINESDIMLANTTGSIIIGFNVRPSVAIQSMAEQDNVEMRLYRVIYDIINDVEAAMKGMLDPEFKEEVLGRAEVRDTFKVPNVGIIAGAYVIDGKIMRNCEIRLVRDGIVIHEGTISSLKRFKDDAKEVAKGLECGIGIEKYNDIKEGDEIECFHMVEIERD
ncbi:MAG: translation initiation factor IF-2 [Clostridia bacterium]|nr:translation initiation factor IF-2 [Clostridia bacterium]